MLYWHFNTTFWSLASHIHFNDKEMFYMWSIFTPFESGKGLVFSAKYYFGKEIKMLTIKEMAVIVAMAKSPDLYKPGSDRLQRRVKYILEQFNRYNNAIYSLRFNGGVLK